MGETKNRSTFSRDRDGDGVDDFFVIGRDREMECPGECRVWIRDGTQRIEIKEVDGNAGDVGVRRLYDASARDVYRAAMWVEVSGSEGFTGRLTIAGYGPSGKKPSGFECNAFSGDTSGNVVRVAIGRDSDEEAGPSGCVVPRGVETIWFKFRANAASDTDHGTVVIDRVWFVRCPNAKDRPRAPDEPGPGDGGCRAADDAPD